MKAADLTFALHPRLAADTAFVADWGLSRVLLMDDARYPWAVLVPRRADVTELFDLDAQDRAALTEEVAHAARVLKAMSAAAKINIGALGNLVPQLHVHIVARNEGDAAWPGPVWGRGAAVRYEPARRDALVEELRARLVT
ncbi:MAG TPA: HIT family protein [Rhizomicrobium sp.]|nr:HIT family protein [Rhizomicrobium sp.]